MVCGGVHEWRRNGVMGAHLVVVAASGEWSAMTALTFLLIAWFGIPVVAAVSVRVQKDRERGRV